MYPLITYSDSQHVKAYRINFRDFSYDLEVFKGQGFGVTLYLVKERESFSDQTNTEEVLKIVANCYHWMRKIEQIKINQQETEFDFKFIKMSQRHQFVSIKKDLQLGLIYDHEKIGSTQLSKSFRLLTENLTRITDNPPTRNRKDITTIQKWQCFGGWGKILELLEALKFDLHKHQTIGDKQSLNGLEQSKLIKLCKQYHIQAEPISRGTRRGMKIIGKPFWNLSAIQDVVKALVEERRDNYFPSYDIFADSISKL